jgi:plastocyanin
MARWLFAAVAVLVVTAAAPAAPAHTQATVLRIFAEPTALKYSTSHLVAKAGRVTIVMTNRSPLRHDVAIKAHGVFLAKGKTVAKGGVSTASAVLKAGKYLFLCTVDAHAAAGMEGTLVVK